MLKLLSASPSPFARKVRIALAEKALPFELATEVPYNADAAAPRHNPLGKVPVLILMEGLRPAAHRSAPWVERQSRKVEAGLAEVARLAPPAGFCVGGRFGLADIAVGCMLGYLPGRYRGSNWRQTHRHLGGLVDRLHERPSLASTLPLPQKMELGVL